MNSWRCFLCSFIPNRFCCPTNQSSWHSLGMFNLLWIAAEWIVLCLLWCRLVHVWPTCTEDAAANDDAHPEAIEDPCSAGRAESENLSRCEFGQVIQWLLNEIFHSICRLCVALTAISICCVVRIRIRFAVAFAVRFSLSANQMPLRLSARRLANMTVNMACNSFARENKNRVDRRRVGKMLKHFTAQINVMSATQKPMAVTSNIIYHFWVASLEASVRRIVLVFYC